MFFSRKACRNNNLNLNPKKDLFVLFFLACISQRNKLSFSAFLFRI